MLEDRQLLAAGLVSWFPGDVSPGDSVSPPTPTAGDVVYFTLDDAVYWNTCVAESAHGGAPTLVFDLDARMIDVVFQPPAPEICFAVYDPVAGLQGELTDLDPGEWTLRGPLSTLVFTVQPPARETVRLPFQTIDQGDTSRYFYDDPGSTGLDLVIQDEATWQEFWAQHTSGFSSPPEIDFESEMVIVTLMGIRPSSGYSTTIQEVIFNLEDGTLTVRVLDQSPGPDDITATVETNPFHIVRSPRVDFTGVVFEHPGLVTDPWCPGAITPWWCG